MPIAQSGGYVPLQQGILILGSSGTQSAVSSGTAETQLASIAVPANTMGANGSLRITAWWSWTNSGNTKSMRIRLGGSSGTAFLTATATTTIVGYCQTWIRNNNATNAQKSVNSATGAFAMGMASALLTGAIDTTATTTVYISGQTASSGETITLEGYTVEFIPGV